MNRQLLCLVSGFAWISLIAVAVPDDFYDENVLYTLELEFSQTDWWDQLTAYYESKENLPATLIVDGVIYEDVGVRFRGNTSYQMTENSEKKSFNIEIDETHEDQRLMGYKTLNLINCLSDPTFMREVLYSNTARQQIPCAKANFVKLKINGENWGMYANVQQLNAEFIEDWFPSNNGTRWRAEGRASGDSGGFPQPPSDPPAGRSIDVLERPGSGGGGVTSGLAALTWQGDDPNTYAAVYELKNSNQDEPWVNLIHTCDVLNNSTLEDLPDVLADALDIDRALWVCAFEIIFLDDDGYVNKRGSDYGLYYEPETGRIHLMQYDGNECMHENTNWSVFYRADDAVVPVMNRLMAIDAYRQRYLAHVRTILDRYLNEEVLWPTMDAYQALIEEEVGLDTKKLYSTEEFYSGISTLKTVIEDRRTTLLQDADVNQAIPEIVSVNTNINQEAEGQSLQVTVQVGNTVPVAEVQLYVSDSPYGRFTANPMTQDSTDQYSLTLTTYVPGTVLRYYAQATAADDVGTVVFSPEGAEHDVYTYVVTYAQSDTSPVVINEVMASNDSTLADPQGDFDDWIELLNTTNDTIDLSGMYLSDNPENPLKWQFADGTLITVGGYLLVWADEDGEDESGLHANFKLSADGETVWLYDTDANQNALLDTVTYGAQDTDQSFGRLPDGGNEWQILAMPTPLAENQ